jgi:putative membrane protein
MTRKPQAFVLDGGKEEPRIKPGSARARIAFEPEAVEQELVAVPAAAAEASPRRFRWGALLISANMALVSLWAGLAITRLVEDFFARSPTLGWMVLAIAGLAGLAAAAIIVREIWGLLRLNKIEGLQEQAARAINLDEQQAARSVETGLRTIYGGRAELAWPLKEYASLANDILDPRDRVLLADRLLLEPLDEAAHRIIARRARRVTLLTTVTPAAALDILFVASQNLGLLREIAALYGGRPSTLSTLRLARMVVTHLAVTGGLALSDSLIQHLVGKGLLGRLSARFGEGAVNGILTSRIGLAAIDVCRPIPGRTPAREALGKLLREVVSFGPKDKANDPREPQSGNTTEP